MPDTLEVCYCTDTLTHLMKEKYCLATVLWDEGPDVALDAFFKPALYHNVYYYSNE